MFLPILKKYYKVITIAGSDSSAGAGIQADNKTFAALGCYGMSVITAVTAQNTTGVKAVHPVPAEMVQAQLQAILSDIGADAVKIGMLYSPEIIQTVAQTLEEFGVKNIVLDPVMVSTSGRRLLQEEAIDVLKTRLIPMASIITPNLPEAKILTGSSILTLEEIKKAALALTELGCQSVLLKGGHSSGNFSTDLLAISKTGQIICFPAERINSLNTHGTGCTLSSAIAAYLAKGYALEEAIAGAKSYITQALSTGKGYTFGQGFGPLHHFFEWWM